MKKNQLSFFYNHYSQDTIVADCEAYQFADWGIKNSIVFQLSSNHKIHELNFKIDSKIFKTAIYNEGWSYVHIDDKYCVIEGLNLPTAKEVLNIVAKENNLETAYLNIGDLNCLFLEVNNIKSFLETGNFEKHLFNDHLKQNIELNELITELKLLDFSEQIFVFGSILNGKMVPPDLDIWIDATTTPISHTIEHKILELVEKYSLRLDPYIKTKDTILALDSNVFTSEFNWIDLKATDKYHTVKNFDVWERPSQTSVSISDLQLLPTQIEELLETKSITHSQKMKI